jgi:glutaredoxin
MTAKLTLYSRKDCCLCDEMKAEIAKLAALVPYELEEVDIDGSATLVQQFGNEVPVLFIDGRKAFKYRVSVAELKKKLGQRPMPILAHLRYAVRKKSR